MAYRTITGNLLASPGSSSLREVLFRRTTTGYTAEDVYPPDEVRVKADAQGRAVPGRGYVGESPFVDGAARVQLWASETSDVPSTYDVIIAGVVLATVDVPTGVTPLTIQELLVLGTPGGSARYETILTYLSNLWRGAWSATPTPAYDRGSYVQSGGSTWIATKDLPAGEPTVANPDWDLVAAKGDPGDGAAGSDLNPQPLGVTAPGVSLELSRADHVHPMPSAADVGAASPLVYTAAVFVASVGNDANTGTRKDQPKATIGSAITAAAGLIAGGAPGVMVHVMDGATYTEDITVPTAVAVVARAATLVGQASITGGSELYLDRHFAAGNNANMLTLEGAGTGPAIYDAHISDGRGTGGALTGVRNVRNVGGGGRNLFVRVGIMYVSTDGTGIGDVSSGDAGHIHMELSDLYLAGNNAVGILGSSQGAGDSNIVGWIDHVLEIGTPTGTVGVSMTSVDAAVKLTAAEIIADTAYNIVAGSLYLDCQRIVGTRTGTPVNRMIGTEDVGVVVEEFGAVSTHNAAADAHGARLPPTPVGQADGRILTVASDALVYADAAGGITEREAASFIAPPSYAIAWDTFDRADGLMGDAPSGQSWVVRDGNAVQVSSGKAFQTANLAGIAHATVDVSPTYPTMAVTAHGLSISTFGGSRTRNYSILLAFVDIDNYIQLAIVNNAQSLLLQKVVAGVATNMVSKVFTFGGIPQDGTRLIHLSAHVYENTAGEMAIVGRLEHAEHEDLAKVRGAITIAGELDLFLRNRTFGIGGQGGGSCAGHFICRRVTL